MQGRLRKSEVLRDEDSGDAEDDVGAESNEQEL